MKITLDRTRPLGEVFPPMKVREDDDSSPIVFFCQDGFHFDNDGNLIEELLTNPQRAAIERKAKQAEAQRKAAAAYEEAMGEPAPPEIVKPPKAQSAPKDGVADGKTDKVDLVAWAKGTKNFPWFAVTKAFKDEFGVVITGKGQAIEYLVHEKALVRSEDVNV